jgi:NTP pyrophosphatase (non-canonical NTP hydrolase)
MTPPTDPSYTAQALRTESPITPALQTRLQQQARLVHAVLGLQTEAGELADPIKKHIYYGRPLDLVNLREEIGDCLWYLAIAADALGTTLEAEQARNLAKLRARYPHVFTAEAAQVRDLDREREVLEGANRNTLGQLFQHAVSDGFSEINSLRQQLAAARAESVAVGKQLDEALKLIADVNTAGLQLWDKLQIANKAAAGLIVERDAARAEIESLRKELANAQRAASDEFAERQVLTVEQQQDAAAWQQQVDSANAEVSYLRARLDEERSVSAGLRQLLDAAHSDYALAQSGTLLHRLDMANATILAQKAGNQYLRLLIDKVRGIVGRDDAMSERLEQISQALDEFDRGTIEPTPSPEVERLQAFVGKVRAARDEHNGLDRDARVEAALAELDAGTEPTPVAEPVPCRERELSEEMQDAVPPSWAPLVLDLRRRLRESQQARGHELERLRAFVGKVRLAMWPEDIKYALAELDAGTIEPTPVAERQWFRTVVQIDGCVGRTTDGITHLETAAVWAAGQSADWRQCVSRTSGQIPDWVWKSMPLHMSYYAEVTFNRQTNMLDFRNWELRPQPTPVAETLDAEGAK